MKHIRKQIDVIGGKEYSFVFENPFFSKKVDPLQEQLYAARRMYLAGTRAATNFVKEDVVTRTKHTLYLPMPSMVCFALSIEIYLDLILEISGVPKTQKLKGFMVYSLRHNLQDRFALLPKNVRLELEKFMRKEGLPNFKQTIQEDKEAFVWFRYPYNYQQETQQLVPESFQDICEKLHLFVIHKSPNLNPKTLEPELPKTINL